MNDFLNMRGVILSQYPSVTAFAKAAGLPQPRVRRLVAGKQKLDSDDICAFAIALHIPDSETFAQIFFNQMTTMWTS